MPPRRRRQAAAAEAMAVLGAAVERAVAGLPASCLVVGAPASGKTTLLRATADVAASRGVTVAWGHNWPGDGAPKLLPWRQLLGVVAPDASAALPARTAFGLREAVLAVVERTAASRPVVLLVDDLQWADRDSVRVFEQVAGRVRGACVVGALRSPSADARSLDVRVDAAHTSVVRLAVPSHHTLGPAARRVLTAAAVLGRGFDVRLAAAAAGVAADEAVQAVAELEAVGLLACDRADRLGWRFTDDHVRDEVLADEAPLARAAHHRAVLAALISWWGDDSDRHAPELARHAVEALPVGEDAAAAAARWTRRAAEERASAGAWDDAARWYGSAARIAGRSPPAERCDTLLGWADALLRADHGRRAADVFDEARRLAEAHSDAARAARAAIGQAEATLSRAGAVGDPHLAVMLTGARRGVGHDASLACLLDELLARLAASAGDVRTAAAAAARAGAAAHAAGPVARAAVAAAKRWARAGPGPLAERVAASRAVWQAADATGDDWRRATAVSWRFMDALEGGDRSELRAAVSWWAVLAERSGMPRLRRTFRDAQATVALVEGRFDDVEALVSTPPGECSGYLALEAVLARDRGDLEGWSAATRALQGYLPARSAAARALQAAADVGCGRIDAARAELERLTGGGYRNVPRNQWWLPTLALLAGVAVSLGDRAAARSLRDRLLPYRDQCVVVPGEVCVFVGAVTHYTGSLAMVIGEPVGAVAELESALAVHRHLHAAPWVARTAFELASALLMRDQHGDETEADALLCEAADLAAVLGMPTVGAQVTALRDASAHTGPSLRPDGAVWHVAFRAAAFRMPDSSGLRCLHHLLARPGAPVEATALVREALGGTPTSEERARVNVTRQIRAAIDRLSTRDRMLGDHLRASVRTGRTCCYAPAEPVRWRLDARTMPEITP